MRWLVGGIIAAVTAFSLPAKAESSHPERDAVLGTTMVVGLVVGGLGFSFGAITGGLSFTKTSELDDACDGDGVCPSEQQDTLDDAQLLSNLSNFGFLAGGVGLAVGLTALVASGESDDVAWSVAPVVDGTAGGFRATLRF